VTTLDARSLRVLRRPPTGAVEGSLRPDGRTVLLRDHAGTVRFLDLATGQVTPGTGRHDGAVRQRCASGSPVTAWDYPAGPAQPSVPVTKEHFAIFPGLVTRSTRRSSPTVAGLARIRAAEGNLASRWP
jgi:hypothetical protein